MPNAFSKVNIGNIVLINKQILFETLEKRIYENHVKIEDLFLLCKAPENEEGEQLVDTPYGKLRVFFVKDERIKKSWLLHKSRFPYPKISKVSSKGSHKEEDLIERPSRTVSLPGRNKMPEVKKDYKIN